MSVSAMRAPLLAALVVLAGCAGAAVKDEKVYDTTFLKKPDQIVVYEFSYAPEQEPGRKGQRELTREEESIGRQVASLVADAMIRELDATGIPTVGASSAGLPRDNSMIVEGEFLSINEGSTAGRMLVGFGVGRSKLVTRSQVFIVAERKKQPVTELQVTADSGYMPGMALGAAGGAATGEWAREMAIAAGGVALETALGNDTIADAKRTGEELAARLSEFMKQKGWVEAKN